MTHPKGLIQGSIYMCDIPDTKRNCVGVYASISEGKLLGIPCHPMQGARLACSNTLPASAVQHADTASATCNDRFCYPSTLHGALRSKHSEGWPPYT